MKKRLELETKSTGEMLASVTVFVFNTYKKIEILKKILSSSLSKLTKQTVNYL